MGFYFLEPKLSINFTFAAKFTNSPFGIRNFTQPPQGRKPRALRSALPAVRKSCAAAI